MSKTDPAWRTLPSSRLKQPAAPTGTVIVRTNPPASGRVAVSGQASSLQPSVNGAVDSIRNPQPPTSYHGENALQEGHYDAVKFYNRWKESFKDPKLIPDLPRKSAVAMFRLITGHDCLSKHLHRIGVLNSPKCLLCAREEDMEMEHLANCETLRTFVDLPSKYWEARRMMTSLLNPEH
ncbi:hypothetical protein ANN_16529 [Periplaneta americana]|uniref:Reverse transcriptase zinc-binding domain-containing protein n=1 Tax=Periplaneta americana TaxID=6978 RepID=A0ABQ8SQM3_PERAM|nr:hypothetical protein ANN_16529 [Periplaneta americana]